MDFDYLKILVSVTLAVIGWLIGHYFTERRNKINKRREISLDHLISAYRIITQDVTHREWDADSRIKFEKVISEIQLFGTKKQVQISIDIINEFAKNRTVNLDILINSLRNDLRNQLGLGKINGNVFHLRTQGNE
ncbi:hypothetical protein [Aureibaculum conchae]|uniref:hypothetical protein n=1 Tax=Aureibaculum sp. 2308TA14-22 TaxID=3108392 RepID=UPI0033941A4A